MVLMCPLLVVADLVAQGSKPQRTPGALNMGSSLGFGAAFPVIQNRPYIATVRVQSFGTTRAGVRVLHEALNIRMRDSAGRIRDEEFASTPDAQGAFNQGTVHILDPISMLDTRWNEDTKTVLATNIAARPSHTQESPALECSQPMRAGNAGSSSDDPDRDQVRYEDLGTREMYGLDAVGCRITRIVPKRSENVWSGTSVTEIWNSPKLQMNLLTTTKELDGTEQITTISDLHEVEPDPALFQVPTGYTDPTKAPSQPSSQTH